MFTRAGNKNHRTREGAFTLVELAVVIMILAILVGIAVPVYLKVEGNADRRVAQYNIRAAEEVHNRIWFDLVERNNFPDDGGSYWDANPPAEMGSVGVEGYIVVDAQYFSKLETRIPWVDMTATGSLITQAPGMFASLSPEVDMLAQVDSGFDFDIDGLYRNGDLVEGAEVWGDDIGKMPGKIAVLIETVFLDYTWCSNPEGKYISMLVMERSGRTYILTFCQGKIVGMSHLIYNPGAGFNFPPGPTDVSDSMKFTPHTLNIDSNGNFHCSYEVDLGEWWGFNEQSFDISTVVCGNAHAVDIKVNEAGKVIITFDREDLTGLEPGDDVPISISGTYTNGETFEGNATIKVVQDNGNNDGEENTYENH